MSVLTAPFATARGDDLALADDASTRSWSELDRRVNQLIDSFRTAGIRPGDTISVVDKPSSQQLALRSMDLTQAIPLVDWLTIDREKLVGTMSRVPTREDIDPVVNEQLIVELYSR